MSIRTLTQEDPIGLAGGLNLYGFAGGDPINFSDTFGLEPLTDEERQKLGNLCDEIDCDKVQVHRGNDDRLRNAFRNGVLKVSGGRAVALGNHIYLPDALAKDISTLAHEVFHSGTYQTLQAMGGRISGAGAYYVFAARDQITALAGGDPYALPSQLNPDRAFSTYGFEQMAQIVGECFLGAADRCAVSPFGPGR